LDIGRKELRSLGSSDGFFNRAETRVCLSESGSRPDFREALQAAAITGESTAAGQSLLLLINIITSLLLFHYYYYFIIIISILRL